MKFKFLFIALLLAGSLSAQYAKQPLYGYQMEHTKSVKAMMYPTGCGTPTVTNSSDSTQAMQYFDSCNHKYFIYDPKLKTWDVFGGGSTATAALSEIVGTGAGPTVSTSTYTDTRLIGLGAQLMIMVNSTVMVNYGSNASFTFNNGTGQINISPNVWVTGESVTIFLNQ